MFGVYQFFGIIVANITEKTAKLKFAFVEIFAVRWKRNATKKE